MDYRKYTLLLLKIILAFFLISNGFNKFYHFISFEHQNPIAQEFLAALANSAYFFQFLGIYEITIGVLILLPWTTALALLMLFPFSINALLFHGFLDMENIGMASILLVLNIYLSIPYFKRYSSLIGKD